MLKLEQYTINPHVVWGCWFQLSSALAQFCRLSNAIDHLKVKRFMSFLFLLCRKGGRSEYLNCYKNMSIIPVLKRSIKQWTKSQDRSLTIFVLYRLKYHLRLVKEKKNDMTKSDYPVTSRNKLPMKNKHNLSAISAWMKLREDSLTSTVMKTIATAMGYEIINEKTVILLEIRLWHSNQILN